MKYPDAPFLELSYYEEGRSGPEALLALVRYLLARGGAFAGTVDVAFRKDIRKASFSHDSDIIENANRKYVEPHELFTLMEDSNAFVRQVFMQDSTGIVADRIELASQLSIHRSSAGIDHSPVGVWVEGESFSGPADEPFGSEAEAIGRKAYRFFRDSVQELRPSYAGITVEYGLPCPADLRNGYGLLAFENFYVSRRFLGASNVSRIRRMFEGAYKEDLPGGVIVSCSEYFNPQRVSVPSSVSESLSCKVGRIIGLHPPHRGSTCRA